jgi:hypothetical protein
MTMENLFYCRNCKGNRKHKILFEKKIRGSEGGDIIQWIDEYKMIQCCGCETISFAKIYGDNQMINTDEEGNYEYYTITTVYPYYIEKGNIIKDEFHLPETIRTVYKETVNAFKVKSYILTAGGFRAIIEAVCNHLDIEKDNLSARINLLYEKGFLTKNESKRLHSIRFLGNDSLHEMGVPKIKQLLVVLEIVNHLLENLFIQDKRMEGNIDVMIDDYDDFMKLLSRLIQSDYLEKEYTLKDILGKSKRLIKVGELKKFEEQLNVEIIEGRNDTFSIVCNKESTEVKYKIEKLPNLMFGW